MAVERRAWSGIWPDVIALAQKYGNAALMGRPFSAALQEDPVGDPAEFPFQIRNLPFRAMSLPLARMVTLSTRASKWNLLLFFPRP